MTRPTARPAIATAIANQFRADDLPPRVQEHIDRFKQTGALPSLDAPSRAYASALMKYGLSTGSFRLRDREIQGRFVTAVGRAQTLTAALAELLEIVTLLEPSGVGRVAVRKGSAGTFWTGTTLAVRLDSLLDAALVKAVAGGVPDSHLDFVSEYLPEGAGQHYDWMRNGNRQALYELQTHTDSLRKAIDGPGALTAAPTQRQIAKQAQALLRFVKKELPSANHMHIAKREDVRPETSDLAYMAARQAWDTCIEAVRIAVASDRDQIIPESFFAGLQANEGRGVQERTATAAMATLLSREIAGDTSNTLAGPAGHNGFGPGSTSTGLSPTL